MSGFSRTCDRPLTSLDDDGNVVVGRGFMTVDQYFDGDETSQRQELHYGCLVREPSSTYGHQTLVMRLLVALEAHVQAIDGGVVIGSPLDVVLDRG